MLNCKLKVISPYNHGSSKVERQIKTISDIIVKHLWDKGQMWLLFVTTAVYAMNTFASEALNGFSSFQLVFVHDCPDLTSLSFPKTDTIPVVYREYYNLLIARAQMVGRLLLKWRTQQALEFENRNRQFTEEEIFEDNQMVYLLAPHSSALQMSTMKFRKYFIGPLFIDTTLDKTHYRLKDATGLLLDGTDHVNHIKKGSAQTLQGIVNTFDDFKKALKNTLLNKSAIESPDNKFVDVTLKDGSKGLMYSPFTLMDYTSFMAKHSMKTKYIIKEQINYKEDEIIDKPLSCTELECNGYETDTDGMINLSRSKLDTGIQYRRQQKDEVKEFIPKPVAQPEYGTVYQHQSMLLQNLHRRYLYIVIRLPKLKDLEQKIPTFPNCDNYGVSRSLNPNLTSDEVKLNDNALHQQICTHFKVDYLEEMDIIKQTKRQIEQKINETLLALLPNKIIQTSKGLATSTGMKGQLHFGSREKRTVPVMVILQAGATIGGTLIKGINALVDVKRAKSFNNALKMVTANGKLTHQRLMTLESRTSMMAKAIMPVLDVLKGRIAETNQKLTCSILGGHVSTEH